MAKAKKVTEQTETDDAQDEREVHIKLAHRGLEKAKTALDVQAIWKEHYLIIGHRVLGRLLLGQDVESATRRRSTKE
jgi:hypothetical protein